MVWMWVLIAVGVVFTISWVYSFFDIDTSWFSFFVAVCCFIGAFAVYQNEQHNAYPKPSAEEACVPDAARPLPAAGTVATTKDDRVGLIYACHYLLDMGITPGKPMPLQGGLNPATFTESSFQAKGNVRGSLFLVFGSIKGSFDASGQTVQRDVYGFMPQTSRGNVKLIIDTGRINTIVCPDECPAQVTVYTSNDALFAKRLDESQLQSIWMVPPDGDAQRQTAVRQVANALPTDQRGAITGGPKLPSEVVPALASKVTVQLPASRANELVGAN